MRSVLNGRKDKKAIFGAVPGSDIDGQVDPVLSYFLPDIKYSPRRRKQAEVKRKPFKHDQAPPFLKDCTTEQVWEQDYITQKVLREFLKDKKLPKRPAGE